MFKDKILYLLLCFGFLGFSQVKKVADTIYIYEEVIVYDTIYIEKPLSKMNFEKVVINPANKGIKSSLTVIQNKQKIEIPIDSLIIEPKRKLFPINWQFGAKVTMGATSNSIAKEFGNQVQIKYGLGVFVKKTFFHPDFSVGIGAEVSIQNSSLQFTDSTATSFLSGYYFTENGSPKLFEGFNNKGFQVQVPIQLYWKIKKFTPSIGVFGNKTSCDASFIESSGNLPLQLDTKQQFKAQTFYFGYLLQLEYAVLKNWSVGISYSYSEGKNIVFKRNSESFAVDKKTSQNALGVNVIYGF